MAAGKESAIKKIEATSVMRDVMGEYFRELATRALHQGFGLAAE